MPIRNDKYIVYKKDDLSPEDVSELFCEGAIPIEDAVVIRLQDVFAGPAFHSYAASMAVALQFIPEGAQRDHLMELADFFHEMALQSDATLQKIPD